MDIWQRTVERAGWSLRTRRLDVRLHALWHVFHGLWSVDALAVPDLAGWARKRGLRCSAVGSTQQDIPRLLAGFSAAPRRRIQVGLCEWHLELLSRRERMGEGVRRPAGVCVARRQTEGGAAGRVFNLGLALQPGARAMEREPAAGHLLRQRGVACARSARRRTALHHPAQRVHSARGRLPAACPKSCRR